MRFSITIPAYKSSYLKEAIDSCLAQTYHDFELVIVNDHSPEDIDSIINQFDDTRIRYYVNEKNCGALNVVDNWNRCLEYAKGDYVICMGDDDRLLPNCLEEYKKLTESNPEFNVFHMRTEIIDENGSVIERLEERLPVESVYSLIWNRQILRRKQFIGDFLFNTKYLRERGGFYKIPLGTFSDDITVAIISSNRGIVNCNHFGFQYREHSMTISRKREWRQIALSAYLAYNWYNNFLSTPIRDQKEDYYRCKTLQNLKYYFQRWYNSMIDADMQDRPTSALLFWISKHKIFNFSVFYVFRLFFHYIRVKKKL